MKIDELEEFLVTKHCEWRWVDEQGRAMTNWKNGDPPLMLDVTDSKGTMRVEVRIKGVAND